MQVSPGVSVVVDAQSNDSVDALQRRIEEETGVALVEQHLVCSGQHITVRDIISQCDNGNELIVTVQSPESLEEDPPAKRRRLLAEETTASSVGGNWARPMPSQTSTVEVAFRDLATHRCMHRVHRFSPGVKIRTLLPIGDQCATYGHWSLITERRVDPSSVSSGAFHNACRAGRLDAIESLVAHYNVDLNERGIGNWTALHTAMVHGQGSVVRRLVALGAEDVATTDGVHASALCPSLWRSCTRENEDDIGSATVLGRPLACRQTRLTRDENLPIDELCHRIWHVVAERGSHVLDPETEVAGGEQYSLMHVLIAAARLGYISLCWVCAELGALLDVLGQAALNVACAAGQVDCVCLLLHWGADVHQAKDNGVTPLFAACLQGHLECARLLLECGAAVDKAMDTGVTPLFLACHNGHLDCVRLLLDHGANIDKVTDEGMTPLWIACCNGELDCARLLLGRGAAVDQATDTGATPLFAACDDDHLDCARLLLDHGAEVDKAKDNGVTPLHFACQMGRLECARLLLERGADKDKAMDAGMTPLFFASGTGQLDCARLLLDHGAEVDKAKDGGVTPLFIACDGDHRECARLLLDRGADVHKVLHDGTTLLSSACQNGHVDCAQLILDSGANVDKAARLGATPLRVACYHGDLECARLLLGRGASVDQLWDNRATPLHDACRNNNRHVAALLFERGADPTKRDNGGKTAAGYARTVGVADSELATVLELAIQDRAAAIERLWGMAPQGPQQ